MSRNDIWFPFYVSDYLRDTQHLNCEEHGSYLLLLISFWIGKGERPDDDGSFASICRCSTEHWVTKLRPKLSPFFQIHDGKWFHKRVLYERERAEHLSEIRSKAGQMGGRPKKQNESKCLTKPKLTETPTQSQSHKEGEGKNGAPRLPPFSEKAGKRISGSEIALRHDELRRVEKSMETLRTKHRGDNWPEPAKIEINRLKSRRQELMKLLGMAA